MANSIYCSIPNCNKNISNVLDMPPYRLVHCDNYETCSYCNSIKPPLCNNHKYEIVCICPNVYKQNIIECTLPFPSNFIKTSIVYYSYCVRGGTFIKFNDGICLCLPSYLSLYYLYKPVSQFHQYIQQRVTFNEFLEQSPQYTYKPVLDSLYQNHIMYIHSLPKDITGIIRTYL